MCSASCFENLRGLALCLLGDVHYLEALPLRDLLACFGRTCCLQKVVESVCLVVPKQSAVFAQCGCRQLGGLEQLSCAHIDVSHVDAVLLEPLVRLVSVLDVCVVHTVI